MRPAGELAGELLDMIEAHIKPGVTTLELNDIVHSFTIKRGGISAPLNYRGYPKSMCTSINDVVCHGIPSAKAKLKEGDIINIDVTPILGGYHGDSSRTFTVGMVPEKTKKLIEVTKECLYLGIAEVKEGARVGDIGHAIQKYAEAQGFSVVRDFVGHGIGKVFHEDPQIFHYGEKGRGLRLETGMVFTIEPMINEGNYRTKVLKDGWTALTIDGSLSAQFEHTLAIRSDWTVEILTYSPAEKKKLGLTPLAQA
ncbi:MAG: type I methionyl aminopeptidase [Chitinophagaceae bacterium]|nr:type I methionyl aminopeptidase [Oligoflexus sp.]